MINYKLFVFLVLTLFAAKVSTGTTFVVTSNADSGPGTFRQALTLAAANGNSEKDFITFQIPSTTEAGRTISILSELPPLSSDLVIDGTTQSGLPFGISDTKIRLFTAYLSSYDGTLRGIRLRNLEFYGIFFDRMDIVADRRAYFLLLHSIKNLIIGSPGKGNLFKNTGIWIYPAGLIPSGNPATYNPANPAELSENIKISSNIIGLDKDGETSAPAHLILDSFTNTVLGGTSIGEGNVINATVSISNHNVAVPASGSLLVSNNRIGVDVSGTKLIRGDLKGSSLSISGTNLESMLITNNQICGPEATGITLGASCFVRVTANKFGTDLTGKIALGLKGWGLVISYCTGGGIIGGTAEEDGNIFQGVTTVGAVVSTVGSPRFELLNNVFKCNLSAYSYQLAPSNVLINVKPVSITARSASYIEGTATPDARVDLYYSYNCTNCEPEKLFASVTADQTGKWSYTGPLQSNNIITTNTFKGETSEFSTIKFTNATSDVKIQMVCGSVLGSIKGLKVANAVNYAWYTESGALVSKTNDLINASPGKYKLVIDDGYCSRTSGLYEIKNETVQVDIANIQITPATCGKSDGGVKGIQSNGASFSWRDSKNNLRSTNLNLANVPAGVYTLTVENAYCSKTYGPFKVEILNGLSIDESSVKISNATCSEANGKIEGLFVNGVAGNLSYLWKNNKQETVGTEKDLLNIPSGKYTLEVSDSKGCQPVVSAEIEIRAQFEIVMNESFATVGSSSCNSPSGSIKGIVVAGASKFEWLNEAGTVVFVTAVPELINAPGGRYKLRASNSGCLKDSKVYTVAQPSSIPFPEFPIAIVYPCNGNNGGIKISFGNDKPVVEWQDSKGIVLGVSNSITNLTAGTYLLYLTDANGCKTLYKAFNLENVLALSINGSEVVIKHEQCGFGNGAISGINVLNGKGPFIYNWKNESGTTISTSAQLVNIKAGAYILEIEDQTSCSYVSTVFVINDEQVDLPPPDVDDVKVCAAGPVKIVVNNSRKGNYRIYETENSEVSIQESEKGIFTVNAILSREYFVSYLDGHCESKRTKVAIKVTSDEFQFVNSFTPNNDGINDIWSIKNIENYADCRIQIYNRNGSVIYQSVGYSQPFDGKHKGKDLPIGTYYYVIELRVGCNPLRGAITLIR